MGDPNRRSQQQPQMRSSSGIAHPLHIQELERHLDLNIFIEQLDSLFAEPLEIPMNAAGTSLDSHTVKRSRTDVWHDERARKHDLSALYNFSTIGKRKWLKNILLEDSDSNSDSDEQITDSDIKVLLKIHKYRRKYQKRYHTDIENSQYTYYAAGLLSEQDRHPQHQRYILDQYGFSLPEPAPRLATPPVVPPPKKISTNNKRRKSSTGAALLRSDSLSFSTFPVDQSLEQPPPSKKSKTANKSPSVVVSCSSVVVTSTISADVKSNEKSLETSGTAVQQHPVEEKPIGMDPALKALWKTIVTEDVPKAHTEKYIAKTYRTIVLKNIAMSCASFLQQAKSGNVPGKNKSRQRRQQKNELMGLRPVPAPKQTPPTSSNSSM